MLRRLIVRAVFALAARVTSTPCAVWFGTRVLVILPGGGIFTLAPDQARDLAEKLRTATSVPTPLKPRP